MSSAPVCHISTNETIKDQPKPTLLPFVPTAVDLPSALQAIAALKMIVALLAGQTIPNFPNGTSLPGLNPPTPSGAVSKRADPSGHTTERYTENRPLRVVQKKRIFQDNDPTSDNWVDIAQVNHVQWTDNVTGEAITWSR